MTAQISPTRPARHHSLRRGLTALGATLVALTVTTSPALAIPPPDRGGSTAGGGAPVPAPAASTTVTESLSTAQVVAISLTVSVIVGLVLVAAVFALGRASRGRRADVILPTQRSEAFLAADETSVATTR